MVNIQIAKPELEAVKAYLNNEIAPSYKSSYEPLGPEGNVSTSDWKHYEEQVVYPAIWKLLEFGWEVEQKDRSKYHPIRFKTVFEPIEELKNQWELDSHKTHWIGQFLNMQRPLIQTLISDYESDPDVKRKHDLFDTLLTDMTGYQFQEYLKEIGLLDKLSK